MAKLTILEYPDSRLRTKAAPVAVVDAGVARLVDDMFETMYAAKGIGLAATQVNVHQRVLVTDVSAEHTQPLTFINPQIIEREGTIEAEEGCLSVPGVYDLLRTRSERIVVRALDRSGKAFEMNLDGLLAVCVQHEIDHLEGKLFVDYLSELKRNRIRKKLEKERRERPAESEKKTRVPAI